MGLSGCYGQGRVLLRRAAAAGQSFRGIMKPLDGLGARGDVVDNLGTLRLWALGTERWQLDVAVVASC